jgi:hypothetical protein
MFKFFKKESTCIKPIPSSVSVSVSISQEPPPYDLKEKYIIPEKIEKLNKKILNNISAEHDDKIMREFNDEIMKQLHNSICEKRIRVLIGFYILSSIEKDFIIETQTDAYDMINNKKKHFPTTTMFVMVKNESIKLILEKSFDDLKKKVTECIPCTVLSAT